MERSRPSKRGFLVVAGLFLGMVGAACVSPIGEEVGAPPRNRGDEEGGTDAGGTGGGTTGNEAGKGGGTTAGGKAGATGKGGEGPGTAGAGGSEAAGMGGSEAAGGTEAAGGSEAAGTGGTDAAGSGGSTTGGTGGSGTAGTGGTSAGMAGMGGMVVEENPCPRVRVNANADPYANIRPEASTAKAAIGKAYPGNILDCLGKANGQVIEGDPNWYHVKSAAFDGWISGTLADCTKDK